MVKWRPRSSVYLFFINVIYLNHSITKELYRVLHHIHLIHGLLSDHYVRITLEISCFINLIQFALTPQIFFFFMGGGIYTFLRFTPFYIICLGFLINLNVVNLVNHSELAIVPSYKPSYIH